MLELNANTAGSSFGVAHEYWQALVWIECEFEIRYAKAALFRDQHWPVIEFASALSSWLRKATPSGPMFNFTSISSEEVPLVSFLPIGGNQWMITSPIQPSEHSIEFPFSDLAAACSSYIEQSQSITQALLSDGLAANIRARQA